MIECKNKDIQLKNLELKNESEKIESFQFSRQKLIIGQWVDVKDTIDQWLEAQVIDVKENKVYIHYNGWGTRWDEWIDMDSDRIMPFRFHTKQTSFSNYISPFPNIKPDANVSVYNQSDTNHQFYDFFNDLDNSFNYCKNIFEKINENRKYIKENIIEKKNFKNKNLSNEKENNLNKNNIHENKNDVMIILDCEPVMETNKNQTENNINLSVNNIIDSQEESQLEARIKQREIFLYSKQLSPFLDRLGRIITDMGSYMFHNMKNNKLEE